MPAGSRSSGPAFICRSIALFVILYQFRLLAQDLADTAVFAAALLCAFAAAWTFVRLRIAPFPACCALFLAPWAARLFITLPRLFVSGPAITLDSLLLNLDRNAFVSLLPYYWAALTSYFSLRSRRFLRGDSIAADLILVILFCVTPSAAMEAYRWPVLMIALFTGVVFLQIAALMLSLPPEFALRKREAIPGALTLLALVILGGALLIRPSQEGAVDRGGGLLQPKMFHFDFSQFLRLESEISMNEDLVLIVHKDAEDTHILTRRFVLSGYNAKQGFYRHEKIDERNHPQRQPGKPTRLGDTDGDDELSASRRLTNQEYFLVNFDSSAFIGMNEPVEIVPFESWDASSFSAAYAVQSYTSEALPFELIDAVRGPPGPETLGLSPEEYAYYTEYGGDRRIAGFASELTQGIEGYWERAQAIYNHLKYGEYRYSLKPGIAPDGDQLSYFLFEVKKGYCSYYAFAMTLMLRSLGIPSRAAVGFFIDPETNVFNYYPVQSNMAHAWVEVYYPGYGWIEYDPTTTKLAADEDFTFSAGVPQDLFERLMKEILENRSRLVPKEGKDDEAAASGLLRLGYQTGRFIRENGVLLIAAALCAWFLVLRCGFLLSMALARNPRKKAIRLWAHTVRRLNLAGLRRGRDMAEAEWAGALDKSRDCAAYALYQAAAAARYAPEYGKEHFDTMKNSYRVFAARYEKTVSLFRRILAWLIPPLALALGPAPRIGSKKTTLLLLMALFLFVRDGGAARTQEQPDGMDADTLYREALNSQIAQYWERAIELYSQAEKLYPDDSRFPMALGSLYYSRQLYGLAWEEYRKAERLQPNTISLLYRLSRIAGHLNWNTISAEYLETILAIEPDDRESIGSLGWMYFKLHRLNEGEELLLAALDRLGPDEEYAMNLGTIYSAMFRYDDSKKWYLEAIAGGEDTGKREFAAIAHYNLALLESRFYKYAESFERTNASLAALNRSSGRLARGELFLRRLDFSRALGEYQTAYELDASPSAKNSASPLPKLNLAQGYQIVGRLEEARLYAEDCLKSKDLSWMISYGIDPGEYKRDIHEILYKTYRGLAQTEGRMFYGSLKERMRGFVRQRYYYLKYMVHERLFRKYSLGAANAYSRDPNAGEGQRLDAYTQYYNAFEAYPRRALRYLTSARDFELPLIPQSAAAYALEEGVLLKHRGRINQTIPMFDPLWERDRIADAYGELALREKSRGRTAEARDAAERLYALNRGALRQRGIALPVELSVETAAAPNPARAGRVLRRSLKTMGIEAVPGSRFRLSITVTGNRSAVCELYDGGRGTAVFSRDLALESFSPKDIAAFAGALGDLAFIAK